MTAQEWKSYGKFVRINNNDLFVIDTAQDETSSKETIVIINGYPSTTYDYHRIIPILSEYYRVIVHDHFGFGFSDLPNTYCFSLMDQANVCIELWKKLNLKNFTILADGYGSKVAKEILYKKNANFISFNIKKLLICNSVTNDIYSDLNTITSFINNKKLAKYKDILMNYKSNHFYQLSEENNKYKDKEKIDRIWQKFNELENQKEALVLCCYNEESYLYWHRWMGALKETNVPVKILWRKDDLSNIKNILLHIASNHHNNIEIIENKNCFVLDKEPINWLLMVLKELDQSIYHSYKYEFATA
ncbi:alpha/beta fold hydrolase [Polaribacter sp.]|uniref:alpha/beta fold hydrolase n=1 Tax=Polaribacter sp. TaxID=1920175 RepID=UPI00404727DA